MSRRESRHTGYPWRSKYWFPFCSAWARSRGRQCRRRVGLRPDGTLHVVCNNHGALTPPYEQRPISEAGKARIGAAATAMWERYRLLKSQGLPVWQVGRKKLSTASPMAKWDWKETPEERKARIAADLLERFGPNPKFRDGLVTVLTCPERGVFIFPQASRDYGKLEPVACYQRK
jgi:hypothetical protein